MAKKEEQRIVGQIEQEEQKLQEIEAKIESYSVRAKECRHMAYTLQIGEPNHENPIQIADFHRQAHYYDLLAEQATYTERHNQLYSLNILKETADRLSHSIRTNEIILSRRQQEVEEINIMAAKMVEDAEQKVKDVRYLIEEQKREKAALEGVEEN